MPAVSINHVSVSADDLDESARFYEDLFGMEPIPTPNFGDPVRWLRVGDGQLHLFKRGVDAPLHHHFALEVDDIGEVYRKAEARGALDGRTHGQHLRALPSGQIQLYLRDPAGNLLEVNWPDVETLPDDLKADLPNLADMHPQSEENRQARLYLSR
jgi:catechol 2,3-dioxygenase-like lactoylglutathione lyase family enzyme